jgi:paraquat-inducible protein A
VSLIACHECDLLQKRTEIPPHSKAVCGRCGAVLYRHIPDSIDHTIALAIAGLVLFICANVFPFLAFEVSGQATQSTLISGAASLYLQGMWALAFLVFVTCIGAPLMQILLMLYIFMPLKFGRLAAHIPLAFRSLREIQAWKLTKMATIIPGLALWSFVGLIVVLTAAATAVDAELVWQKLDSNNGKR